MAENYLAKSSGITLVEHTRDVVEAAQNLIQSLPFNDEERDFWLDKIVRCAKLHDIGKIHPWFQENLKAGKSVKPVRHEIISLWLIEQFLELPHDECFAIATHHKGVALGSMDSSYGRLDLDILVHNMPELIEKFYDFETLREFMDDWNHRFDLNLKSKNITSIQPELTSNIIKLLREKCHQKVEKDSESRFHLAKTRGLLIASDHIGSARLQHEIPSWKKLSVKMFQPRNKKGKPHDFRDFQQKLQSVAKDVILYAPTGSGKTEAALCWYVKNQRENCRLFYLLPYTASINAMVKRLQTIFGEETVTALHSKTLDFFFEQLEEENDNHEKNQERAKTLKTFSKELFFPIKIATPHQVLKNALMGKGWEMSLFDYQNACFIIDEFHTYDALMTGLMLATVKWLKDNFSAKIFFMSATIPQFLKDLIIEKLYDGDTSVFRQPNPEISSDRAVLDRKRHQLFCCENQSIRDKIDLIKTYLNDGKFVLVIVNNVKTCQELFNEIDFTEDVRLLHSGFNKRDRIEIEQHITDENSKPQLLIATQAVEVSLDIDYDVAFIENAPIDALIQRFGRVNRTGKKGVVPVYIFENIIGNTKFFYNEEVLRLTFENLRTLNEKYLSEADLVNVCNQVYKNGYNEEQQETFERGFNNSIIREFNEKLIAGHWKPWIEEVIEGQTIKIDVLCSNLLDEYIELKESGNFIRANQLLVSVYRYETKEKYVLDEKVIVSCDLFYDELIGYKEVNSSEDIIL